jgi:hypothetical protein
VGREEGAEIVQTLKQACEQLRQCLVASKNRRDLNNFDPNFPDTQRYTIFRGDAQSLGGAFLLLQQSDEFKHLYPAMQYRFEVATSGSGGPNVWDFKISPIVGLGNTGAAIFNYHIGVVDPN